MLICVSSQRQNAGAGLVSTLPDMVALIRRLLRGGPTLLKPHTIELMMTNQLPEGVWIRFAGFGELHCKGYGLAGALILEPFAFEHRDANTAGPIMAQREMGHPFVVEFKRLAYEAIGRSFLDVVHQLQFPTKGHTLKRCWCAILDLHGASRRAGSARHNPFIQFLIDDLDRAVDLGIGHAKLIRDQLHQQVDPLNERRSIGHRPGRR